MTLCFKILKYCRSEDSWWCAVIFTSLEMSIDILSLLGTAQWWSSSDRLLSSVDCCGEKTQLLNGYNYSSRAYDYLCNKHIFDTQCLPIIHMKLEYINILGVPEKRSFLFFNLNNIKSTPLVIWIYLWLSIGNIHYIQIYTTSIILWTKVSNPNFSITFYQRFFYIP